MWLGAVAVLILLALGLTRIDLGLAENEQFARDVEAVEGAEVLARVGFEQGGGAPLQIVVPDAGRADAVADAVRRLEEVARVLEPERGEPGALVGGPLAEDYDTREAAERDNWWSCRRPSRSCC